MSLLQTVPLKAPCTGGAPGLAVVLLWLSSRAGLRTGDTDHIPDCGQAHEAFCL